MHASTTYPSPPNTCPAQQRLQQADAPPAALPNPRCPVALLRLFQARAFALVERLALKLQRLTEGEGKTQQQAWRLCLVDVMGVSRCVRVACIVCRPAYP